MVKKISFLNFKEERKNFYNIRLYNSQVGNLNGTSAVFNFKSLRPAAQFKAGSGKTFNPGKFRQNEFSLDEQAAFQTVAGKQPGCEQNIIYVHRSHMSLIC